MRRKEESRKKVMIMTVKCLQKCGEVCQRKIGGVFIALLGFMSFAAIMLVFIS
jgi:hypothetical protein